MTIQTTRLTVEEFDRIVLLPENAERNLEYIGGEIHVMVSNQYASAVAARILIKLGMFLEGKDLGILTGADGGYQVSGERYIPDVGFISKARQSTPSHDTYNPHAPDLAVEVLSPTDDLSLVRIKITNYLAAGTVVWLVDPDAKHVEIHAPGQKAQRLGVEDTLTGGDVLPGFAVKVGDVFPE